MINYSVGFERALSCGEIVGQGMTNDKALIELKKWKDKLDLDIITKEEYENKKLELIQYIK